MLQNGIFLFHKLCLTDEHSSTWPFVGSTWQMLKAPPLKSLALDILVFQERSQRGAFIIFKKKMFEKALK